MQYLSLMQALETPRIKVTRLPPLILTSLTLALMNQSQKSLTNNHKSSNTEKISPRETLFEFLSLNF